MMFQCDKCGAIVDPPKGKRRLLEVYPPDWRRWCDAPENGGCFCMGCVRHPAPSTVRGDPEGMAFPNPEDRITREEMMAYEAGEGVG